MENRIDKEYQRTRRGGDIYTESSAEYVIPDYKGDIRKLLLTDAQIRPSGRFASGGEVEFSGVVVYNIVYADNDGEINSASFTSDYDYKLKCNESDYINSFADARVSSVSIRLVGPRKVCAKATVAASASVIERASVCASGTSFAGDEQPELLTKYVSTRKSAVSESAEREYAEVVAALDGAIADEVNVIYSGADVNVDSIEFDDGIITLDGSVTLFALIKNGDAPIFIADKTIDFEQDVPFADGSDDMSFLPTATVVSLRDTVNPTESGVEVVLSAIVEFSAIGESNSETELVEDAYMRSCVCENEYDDFGYCEFVSLTSIDDKVEGTVERESVDCEGLREIVALCAQAKIDSVDCAGTDVTLHGEVRYSGIACGVNAEGKPTYSPVKFASEFSKNVKLSCQISDKTRVEPKITLSHIRGGIDEASVWASADVKISLCVLEDKCARVLHSSNAREDMPFEERGAKVSVYYPSSDETLFDVAKRFHTTVAKLAMDNSLSASVSTGEEPLSQKLMIF